MSGPAIALGVPFVTLFGIFLAAGGWSILSGNGSVGGRIFALVMIVAGVAMLTTMTIGLLSFLRASEKGD